MNKVTQAARVAKNELTVSKLGCMQKGVQGMSGTARAALKLLTYSPFCDNHICIIDFHIFGAPSTENHFCLTAWNPWKICQQLQSCLFAHSQVI